MKLSDLDYALPPHLIAQTPLADRDRARLLVLDRATGARRHATIADLPQILRPGDVIVVNDTRVFPARLLGRRVPSGGAVECLLLGHLGADRWDALVHPGQKLKPGSRAVLEGPHGRLQMEVVARHFHGRRTIRLWTEDDSPVDEVVDAIGHVPLPPYIHRPDRPEDRERYQTMFARARGSVAAPTAGLHFTPAIVDRLMARGVTVAAITLHVGYGTFEPVRSERVEDHHVQPEWFDIPAATADTVNRALDEGRRVVAVGTTTTRTLEAAGQRSGGRVAPGQGVTDLFIYPGFSFGIVGGLLTNFHLPRSSLLLLVCAFAGREHVLAAYQEAVQMEYRFYSYGDAMLIL